MEKSNSEIVLFLNKAADLLDLAGESGFKSRAFRNAAAVIEDIGNPVSELALEGVAGLVKLPGIGKGIATQLVEFVAHGTSTSYEDLCDRSPESALELLEVRGIGPKIGAILHQGFGVLDFDDLVRFAEGGGFEAIPGLGDKVVSNLVAAVEKHRRAVSQTPAADARAIAGRATEFLCALDGVTAVELAGDLRRGKDMVRSVDVLAVHVDADARIRNAFEVENPLGSLTLAAQNRLELLATNGLRVRVFLTDVGSKGPAWIRATGSRRHVRELEELALERGLEFRRNVLSDASGSKRIALEAQTEKDVYSRLGLRFIDPCDREGIGEIDAARDQRARKKMST